MATFPSPDRCRSFEQQYSIVSNNLFFYQEKTRQGGSQSRPWAMSIPLKLFYGCWKQRECIFVYVHTIPFCRYPPNLELALHEEMRFVDRIVLYGYIGESWHLLVDKSKWESPLFSLIYEKNNLSNVKRIRRLSV